MYDLRSLFSSFSSIFFAFANLPPSFVQSLFIGVITMGMFDAFEKMKTEIKDKRYQVLIPPSLSTFFIPRALEDTFRERISIFCISV